MSRTIRLASACCAAAILAACDASGRAGTPATSSALPALRQGSQHRISWMAGGLAKQDLLYVSNGNSEVTVYRFWKRTLVGVLTSFTQPMGECTDNASNVYITDYAAKAVFEYAHGGTKAIKRFDDSSESPYACATDPTTGSLAVANYDGTSLPGSVAIWPKGSDDPTIYTNSQLYYFRGLAFDSSGNLLVTNGYRSGQGAQFRVAPQGR